MAPISEAAFRRALARLDRAELARFVAALWTARGTPARVDDGVVRVGGDGERRVWVRPAARLPRWSSNVPEGVDLVVSADDRRVPVGVDRVGPADLRNAALYAVSPDERDRLFDDHLGVDPVGHDGTTATVTVAPGTSHEGDGRSGNGRSTALRWVVAVALVAVVVLAAWGGVGGGPDEQVETVPDRGAFGVTGTATPVSASEDAGTVGRRAFESALAPGLARNGVVDVDRLAAAHAAWVDGRSYTVALWYNESVDGETVVSVRETVFVAAPSVYRTTLDRTGAYRTDVGPVVLQEAYANGSVRYTRTSHASGSSFDRTTVGDGDADRYAVRFGETVRRYLAVQRSTTVGRVNVHGTRYFLVRGHGSESPGTENYTVTALVDDTGFVRQFGVEYAVPGEPVRVTVRAVYRDVGETTVDRPGWYEAAVDQGWSGVNATVGNDGNGNGSDGNASEGNAGER